MRNRYLVIAIAVIGWMNSSVSMADPANAPARRIGVLELYTSEGCSSCPPMDHWISRLPRPQLVPNNLVVLAFHVDYWNHLGWPDRFSQAQFTQRQQARVRSNGLRTAYTPQLILNGRDYRERGDIDAQVARINAQTSAFQLNLKSERQGAAFKIRVTIKPTLPAQGEPIELYVALYENNLETQVKAGENRGERLRHDYVVRSLIGPVAVASNPITHWDGHIPISPEWKLENIGLAAFVQSTASGEVLQATAQELPR